MNWDKFRFIDLFAGIGGIRLGFESVGGECVFSSEIDDNACKTYEANFGEHPSGDITKIDSKDIPDFDILLAGFPCQAFSIIGKQEGFSNETCGTLFFDIERILRDKRPKAFMLENVRNLVAHDGGKTFKIIIKHLEALGYNVFSKIMNALDYGVPQKRERIIIVGFLDDVFFTFPTPLPKSRRLTLEDILEKNVPEKYYVKDSIRQSRLQRLKNKNYPKPYISHENIGGSITPHLYSAALRAGASANYILVNDERRPTEREMLRLQGFPDSFKIVVPYGHIRHQCGNSVAVPVIKAVAKQMITTLKNYSRMSDSVKDAKEVLDKVINKSRVHFYKPIQIAEILYRHRVHKDINLLNLEDYRTVSKKWRDEMCKPLLGRVCTSSAKFQDDIFNQIPPTILDILGQANIAGRGIVEAYIYGKFSAKHDQMSNALDYCYSTKYTDFDVKKFIDSFWRAPGLKRSLDKIYEIVVYSLFTTLIRALDLNVEISVRKEMYPLLQEFDDFSKKIMCLDFTNPVHTERANVFRVGVTNAADRGLDMYSNWGPAIQIKHLSLDVELAKNIVCSVASDRIVIVCKDAERDIIVSLLNQIGWAAKIQSVVTENDLICWYEKALRGKYASKIGNELIKSLQSEIEKEFPSVSRVPQSLLKRNYDMLHDGFWT